ncbi:M14 family zinc carboxypeptidase [Roseateles sp.]|uniref:M14 family zinc carboxypeptidase n=1 Tax=Roseateles sp. TaxID=1971397 RepID=UPI002DFCB3A0|nr:M14 family zinc carboxypeptidase [Roseateles sp.]HEV6967185.1 M14 family zinc carboxypeptidase [Roseateles sp.]
MLRHLLPWLALVAGHIAAAAPQPALSTLAERSGFAETGRYAEVGELCHGFARAHPRKVRCTEFGRTPQGRPMWAVVASQSGALTPEAARRAGLPVTLIQGGIHAGEIEGKDAGFLALREQLARPGALKAQVLVFVPVFNADGHERFSAWNRPNQRGPERMGWRVTAQNLNLNRDYMKADAPEMQAMLGLVRTWDPLVAVDLHTTDGAQFEHDVAVMVEPVHAGDAALREAGRAWRDGVIDALAGQGALPLAFYPSFVEMDNPASGFKETLPTPRFSHGYFMLRNRLGMLVETHSWRPYAHRVRLTRQAVDAVLDQVVRHGGDWLRAAHAADARPPAELPLTWRTTDEARDIDFRGYAYTRSPSEVSGASMTRYDETRPEVWRVPLRDHIVPDLVRAAPRAGYLVPAEHAAWVGEKLAQHGVRFERLAAPRPGLAVQAFRATAVKRDAATTEGRQRMALAGAWAGETRDLPAGSLFVPIAQPLAALAMQLLEPDAPDSLAAWGRFAPAFEAKEYMEPYVAERVAREQLAASPALREAFAARLRDDPAFAADARARLDFFYRRSPSWDERLNLYPVLRVDARP